MNSLRTKFILVLLAACILMAVIVAILTPVMIEHEFVERAKEAHYGRFSQAIGRYIERNQSWGTEEDAMRFAEMAQRGRERMLGDPPANGRPLPPHLLGNFEEPGSPAPGALATAGMLSFEFVLFDTQGNVLHGGKDYQPGQKVDPSAFDSADPITYKTSVVAYAVPSGTTPLTPTDEAHLHTLQETLFFSALCALLLIIPFVIWESRKLVGSLNQLILAVNKMGKGELEQQVPIKSSDEVGVLASAFNSMNSQLVEAYNKLEESRDMVARQAEQLRELSIRDELTGLYNRRFFNEEVTVLHANAIRYGHAFCVVLGDIDHFKKINDNFSHTTGDEVLKTVAHILQTSIRSSDIVARYGGEEMVLALPNTSPKSAWDMMERVRTTIENHPWHNIAEGLIVTMSFGICDEPTGDDYEHMLIVADEQLYKAKHSGRNQVCSLSLTQNA
ncbi:GGDEF domain-containing protein [Hahella sp. CCB-MM4]|uniref:diguanylate cyclase n=1 Tax=Hahella sp. (strain CCB-MM4) TaxID=1926491 RepID=UPI000B9AAE78|nr:diguanylate cyclase [Hahella sp. CCB-MM4]OZG72934.1 GGDEF domain-containing protein [Hahella sp. CCB-MM4]